MDATPEKKPRKQKKPKVVTIQKVSRKIEFLTGFVMRGQERVADLHEILENHLDDREYTTPIDAASKEELRQVLGSYHKQLKRKYPEGNNIHKEYGVSVSHLSRYLQIPLKEMERMIKSGEVPAPKSVFNGEIRYNLLQMVSISNRDKLPKPLVDRSKEWYTHLNAQALQELEKRTLKLMVAEKMLDIQRDSERHERLIGLNEVTGTLVVTSETPGLPG